MDELISRQQAIEVVQNRHMMLSKEKVLLINDLEKLPSAQPEPPEECERCMMEHTDEMEKLEAELAIAKSKQPEPCEDAVSRQEVADILENADPDLYVDLFNKLPSVTPKQRTGKWIEYEQKFMTDRPFETIKKHVRECSLCRTKIAGFDGTMRYCPNCGAKMGVTE